MHKLTGASSDADNSINRVSGEYRCGQASVRLIAAVFVSSFADIWEVSGWCVSIGMLLLAIAAKDSVNVS